MEVTLVLAVTAITFLAIYSLYANTIRNDMETRHEIIAANLAQEGVEMMRNIRDEEQLSGNDIDNGYAASPCYPYMSGQDSVCDATVRIANVEFDGTNYRNCNFSGGCGADLQTPFDRECTYTQDETGPGGETVRMTVTCTVSWDSFVNSSLRRQVQATSVMTDWLSY